MKTECPLSSALLSFLTGGEGSPLMLRTEHNRTEYLYMCEVTLNLQLQDLMCAAGVPFPRRLCTTFQHGKQR